jgi:hypothetical protein
MIFQVGVGGSTASRPTDERPPNDPEKGGSGSGHFAPPAAWAAWNQPQPDPAAALPPSMPGSGPGVPQDASAAPGRSNPTSPLYRSVLEGPGGLPANPADYGPRTRAAIASNDDFVRDYGMQQQAHRSRLMDALSGMAGLAGFTNPYSGMTSSARTYGG